MIRRHFTHKRPLRRGKFSYARIPLPNGRGLTFRLFRRDDRDALHCVEACFAAEGPARYVAQELNVARHQLRNTVDDIDLKFMGVTA